MQSSAVLQTNPRIDRIDRWTDRYDRTTWARGVEGRERKRGEGLLMLMQMQMLMQRDA